MSLFCIADLHLSFHADKSMEVFRGWERYTQRLEENWKAIVSPEDTVVLAGDISWGMKLEDTREDFAYLHSLPGKKLILKGNHDYWWSTRTKIEKFWADCGFDDLSLVHNSACPVGEIAVCGTRGWLYNSETAEDRKIVAREAGRLNASLDEAEKLGLRPVVFLHYPPVYDNMECRGILDILVERGVKECYYGHVHGTQAARRAPVGEYRGVKMHLISADYVKFVPTLVR